MPHRRKICGILNRRLFQRPGRRGIQDNRNLLRAAVAAQEEALAGYPGKLFITEGKQGVRYSDGTAERLVPASIVDCFSGRAGAGFRITGICCARQ
jgi:hypothetical protein